MSSNRLLWLTIILAFILLYIPINRFVSGGWIPSKPIDDHIPLYAPAVIPYLLATLLFVGFPIWAALHSRANEFEAYTISILVATLISYIIYLTIPTFVIRPEVEARDFFSVIVVLLYQNDYPSNATPSSHAFYTVLSFLYLRRWKPGLQVLWLIFALIIMSSALLTKQHYMLDILTGILLGLLAFWAGLYIQKKWDFRFASD